MSHVDKSMLPITDNPSYFKVFQELISRVETGVMEPYNTAEALRTMQNTLNKLYAHVEDLETFILKTNEMIVKQGHMPTIIQFSLMVKQMQERNKGV